MIVVDVALKGGGWDWGCCFAFAFAFAFDFAFVLALVFVLGCCACGNSVSVPHGQNLVGRFVVTVGSLGKECHFVKGSGIHV